MCSHYSSSSSNTNSNNEKTIIPCILVTGSKNDVMKKSFKFASDHHNMPFFFVSSANGMNVDKVFEEAICIYGVGTEEVYGE